MKATRGRSDAFSQAEVRVDKIRRGWLSDDPAVLRLASNGYHVFTQKAAQRILADHKDEVFLNCPKYGALARTPKAKQCRFCKFDWH
jgi:hypothetical protein